MHDPVASGGSPVSASGTRPLKKHRVAVFAGPTGGHLFPAQSFCEGFRKRFPQATIELITSHRAQDLIAKVPAGIFDRVHYLPEFGFAARFSLATLKPFLLAPYLFLKSFFYLTKSRPDICVGFASFASYPGMMTAHAFGIPTLIHEQNQVPGKATQWLAPHMDVVAESFPGTRFSAKVKTVRTVGLPLRAGLVNAGGKGSALTAARPIEILVVGGSQGAWGLNEAVVSALGQLSPEERSKIAVTHITGKRDQQRVAAQYRQWALAGEVLSFCTTMNDLFNKADLAITRAGANTLFELAFFGIPALVVPYPHAGGHQEYNAQCFAAKGGLLYHKEDPQAAAWLLDQLRQFIGTPEELDRFSKAMAALARPRATDDLVTLAEGLIRKS